MQGYIKDRLWLKISWQNAGEMMFYVQHVDGLVQERRNSNALAMELRVSYTNASMCTVLKHITKWNRGLNIMADILLMIVLNEFIFLEGLNFDSNLNWFG